MHQIMGPRLHAMSSVQNLNANRVSFLNSLLFQYVPASEKNEKK